MINNKRKHKRTIKTNLQQNCLYLILQNTVCDVQISKNSPIFPHLLYGHMAILCNVNQREKKFCQIEGTK